MGMVLRRHAHAVMAAVASTFLFPAAVGAELGVDWTRATAGAAFSQRFAHAVAVFQGKMWLVGGYEFGTGTVKNDVWNSVDGVTWTQVTASAPFPARYDHSLVVFQDKLWVLGGTHASAAPTGIWSSPDGISWTEVTTTGGMSTTGEYPVTVHNDKLWANTGAMIFGSKIWSSANGADWQLVNGDTPFVSRRGHTLSSFDGKLWILGGYGPAGSGSVRGDHWYSADGVTWTGVTTGTRPFMEHHSSVVMDGRLWSLGGVYTLYLGDVWASGNGTAWTKLLEQNVSSTHFSARWRHASVVYKNRMWVIGGMDQPTPYCNDVWYSENASGSTIQSIADSTPVTVDLGSGLDAIVSPTGVQTPGNVELVLNSGDTAPAGYSASQLIDSSLTVNAEAGFSASSVQLSVEYAEGQLGGVPEGSIVSVLRDTGSTVQVLPATVDTVNNRITFTTTGFSTFYFGSVPLSASVDGWESY